MTNPEWNLISEVDRNQLWSNFLELWPLERVRQMTLEEYTNLNKDNSFIYWIEFRLADLGSIAGGSAFKFGIYRRDQTAAKETSTTRTWGEKYAWLSKLGSTEQEAFAIVRSRLVEVVEATREGNLARVDPVDLAPIYKWKVAFLYQDRSKPTVFPIYKKEMLFSNYRRIDQQARLTSTPYSVMYETLWELHHDRGDVFDVALALWEQYQAGLKPPSRAWAIPLAWTLQEPEALETFCNKSKIEPEDQIASLDHLLSSVELAEGDQLALLINGDVRALGTLTHSDSGQFAWTQVPVNFPSGLLVLPTSEIRELSKVERQEIWSHLKSKGHFKLIPSPVNEKKPDAPAPPCNPRNIVLYGPPGTGKTYSTVRRALELTLSPEKLAGLGDKGLLALFREHQARGQIEFVTFHQAYGYEEFVEGIRPVLDQSADAEVRYEIHEGVFKRIALRAAAQGVRVEGAIQEFDVLWDFLVRDLATEGERVATSASGKQYQLRLTSQGNILSRSCEVDSEGTVASVSQGFQTASKDNARLYWENRGELGPEPEKFTYEKTTKLFAREKGGTGGNHYTALWMAYSQLWTLSRSSGARKSDQADRLARVQQALDKPGATTTFSFSAQTPQYVLIIDEINRGNVSKILGELITLLEPDKRLTAASELKLPLSYTPQHRFAVPPNLHILGTMNTADRSIALMDVALRRRFTFEELMPDVGVIRSALHDRAPGAFVDLVADLFEALNDRIRFLYDRDHQLGHSYFLNVTDAQSLRQVFLDRIVPMLQEYFYGAWDKICIVLGCPYSESGLPRRGDAHLLVTGGKSYTYPMITACPFPEFKTLGFDHDDYEDRVDYIVAKAFREGSLSQENLFRTFLGVLPPGAFDYRLTSLMASDPPSADPLETPS